MIKLIVILCMITFWANANSVKSLDGVIRFDRDSDHNSEMILNQTGLGISTIPSTKLEIAGNAIVMKRLLVGDEISSQNNLHIKGSFSLQPKLVGAGNISLSDSSLVLVDSSSGDQAITLPLANSATGKTYRIKQISRGGNLHLSAGGNLIDHYLSITLSEQGQDLPSIKVFSDGTQWWILNIESDMNNIVSSNLMMEYRLDELSGILAMDNSVSERTAVLMNNHNFSGNSVNGPQSSALQFDDEEDSLNYHHLNNLVTHAYAWSLWINSIIDPDLSPSFNMSDVNAEAFGFNWNSGNTLWRKSAFHKLSNDTYVLAQINTDLSASTWYHVAASWDGSQIKLYLNGELESTQTATSLKTQSGLLKLRNPGGESNPITKIDHFKFYNKALNASEIKALFEAGRP